MPKSNLYMNWDGVTAKYGETPTVIDIGEVTSVKVDGKEVLEVFFGDNRRYPKLIRPAAYSRSIEIEGGNVAKLLQIPAGVECEVTAYLNDAVNGRGLGCLIVNAVRAVREGNSSAGPNNKFAGGSVKFMCSGTVSATPNLNDKDPITITEVTT